MAQNPITITNIDNLNIDLSNLCISTKLDLPSSIKSVLVTTELESKITKINKRIQDEACEITINMLTDTSMLEEYKHCASVKLGIDKLSAILTKYGIEDSKKANIINDYLVELIPPGTKGVMRGNKFNKIVEDRITGLKLDIARFEVKFEKQCNVCMTTEIPDWYILEKATGKVIIGMNQLDLWGGGQQNNRGSKYLIDNKLNTDKSKLVCVVCNKINFTLQKNGSLPKNKAYKLFEIGFANNTLCYLNNIDNIITQYFN